MSLKEAVLEIADEMEKSIKDYSDEYTTVTALLVGSYAKQLRLAVKTTTDSGLPSDPLKLMTFGTQLESKAKAIIDKQRERQNEDVAVTGDSIALCVGGSCDGDYMPINPAMPRGAFTNFGDQVYQLKDGKLHYRSDLEVPRQ